MKDSFVIYYGQTQMKVCKPSHKINKEVFHVYLVGKQFKNLLRNMT